MEKKNTMTKKISILIIQSMKYATFFVFFIINLIQPTGNFNAAGYTVADTDYYHLHIESTTEVPVGNTFVNLKEMWMF